jgi:hypothetical protein
VTQHGGVMMSVEGDAAQGKRKRGDDVSWSDANLTGAKNKENSSDRFSYYKLMKI